MTAPLPVVALLYEGEEREVVRTHTDGKHGWVRLDLDDIGIDAEHFMRPGGALVLLYSLALSIVGMGTVYDDPGDPRDEAFRLQQRAIAHFLVEQDAIDATALEHAHELHRYGADNVRQVLRRNAA